MRPVLYDGVVMNAAALDSDVVVSQRVKCPACGVFTFQKWPEGWDAHAESRCEGLNAGSPVQRKEEFKKKFGNLFR